MLPVRSVLILALSPVTAGLSFAKQNDDISLSNDISGLSFDFPLEYKGLECDQSQRDKFFAEIKSITPWLTHFIDKKTGVEEPLVQAFVPEPIRKNSDEYQIYMRELQDFAERLETDLKRPNSNFGRRPNVPIICPTSTKGKEEYCDPVNYDQVLAAWSKPDPRFPKGSLALCPLLNNAVTTEAKLGETGLCKLENDLKFYDTFGMLVFISDFIM